MAARRPKPKAQPKPRTVKVKALPEWGPAQERALAEMEQLSYNTATFDVESTGLGRACEIWEIAVHDVATGGLLFESYVAPMCTVEQWESQAFYMVGGVSPRPTQPTLWQCPVTGCRFEEWVPPRPDDNWRTSPKVRACRDHWREHLKTFPAFRVVEEQLLEAIGGRRLAIWSGEKRGDEPFDRRLWSQSREAVLLDPLSPTDLPVTNIKAIHRALRAREYAAMKFPKDLRGGLARAAMVEGLKFTGIEHRARTDSEMVAKVIKASIRPTEDQELGAVEHTLNLTRRLRMSGQADRDDLVLGASGAQVPRWQRDASLHEALAGRASEAGMPRVAEAYMDFVQESRSGIYRPVEDPVFEIHFPAPRRPRTEPLYEAGSFVQMSQEVLWRYGQVAQVIDVQGIAPHESYRLRFEDGETLTYKEASIAGPATDDEAKEEGFTTRKQEKQK